MSSARKRRARARRREADRKDRLIQTRVDEDLEQTLKREAARRRLTVSHLIRNTLEDAFELVEGMSKDVEQLVSGSVELAATVKRDAQRIASIVRRGPTSGDHSVAEQRSSDRESGRAAPSIDRERAEPNASSGADSEPASERVAPKHRQVSAPDESSVNVDGLAHVFGWNRVIANQPAACVKCGIGIDRGDDAWIGLSDQPQKPRAWLCPACAERL